MNHNSLMTYKKDILIAITNKLFFRKSDMMKNLHALIYHACTERQKASFTASNDLAESVSGWKKK